MGQGRSWLSSPSIGYRPCVRDTVPLYGEEGSVTSFVCIRFKEERTFTPNFINCTSFITTSTNTQHYAERTCKCSASKTTELTSQNTASSLASGAVNTASNLASSAATAVGYGHSHAEEHAHRSTLPPDAEAGQVKKMDSEGLAVFEDEGVRHEVLVKLNKLAM